VKRVPNLHHKHEEGGGTAWADGSPHNPRADSPSSVEAAAVICSIESISGRNPSSSPWTDWVMRAGTSTRRPLTRAAFSHTWHGEAKAGESTW